MSRASSLFVTQLQNSRLPVDVFKSTPSSECCGCRPSRMLRYFTVTLDDLRIFSTSPLLPEGIVNGGGLRAMVELREKVAGPFSGHGPGEEPAGGSPVMTTLKRPFNTTGSPTHIP